MSSTPPTPTPPPAAAVAAPAPQPPPGTIPFRNRIQNLSPAAKGAIVVVLLALVVAWYIFTGQVTTDDAQVDSHITAMAPQVPGYVVNLLINDNTPVTEGDL